MVKIILEDWLKSGVILSIDREVLKYTSTHLVNKIDYNFLKSYVAIYNTAKL